MLPFEDFFPSHKKGYIHIIFNRSKNVAESRDDETSEELIFW